MSNSFKSKAFQKLQEKWYKKLAKSGFSDIEEPNSPKEMLKRWDSHYFANRAAGNPDGHTAKAQYYQNAAHMLEWYSFDTATDKRIWALHADGLSNPEIMKRLGYTYWKVNKAVQKLRKVLL